MNSFFQKNIYNKEFTSYDDKNNNNSKELNTINKSTNMFMNTIVSEEKKIKQDDIGMDYYKNIKHCKSCGSDKIVENYRDGDIVCTMCGIVQESRIVSLEEDWSNYESTRENGKDNSRVGYTDHSNPYATLGTIIPKNTFVDVYVNGKLVKYDLSKIQSMMCMTNKERAFYEVSKIFENLTYNGFVSPKVVGFAKKLWYVIAEEKQIFRGGNRKGILACCILYSTFENKCSKTRKQIAEEMTISMDDITKGEPIFQDIIGKSKYKYILESNTNAEDMFWPIINELELPFSFVKECTDVHITCEEELSEISSSAAIGGIISFVIHKKHKLRKPTKKRLLEIIKITNPTLSNSVKIIERAQRT